MKLSNKVLLGFFGIIFLYLTAAFTELRLTGTSRLIADKNSVAETVDLPGIAYVIINDVDQYVKVIASDTARLEVRSIAGDLLRKLTYKVSGDTLVLSDFQSEGVKRVSISVFVANASLKGVTVNRSVSGIEGLQQENLELSENSGRISMSNNKISKVRMDLSNSSYLNIEDTKVDTLSVTIDSSQLHVSSPVGFLQGSIKHKAYLRLNALLEISLKKDESSSMHLHP